MAPQEPPAVDPSANGHAGDAGQRPAGPAAPDEPDATPGGRHRRKPGRTRGNSLYDQTCLELAVDAVAFAARAIEERKARGWSLDALEAVSGIAKSTLSDLERAKHDLPSVLHTLTLARLYNYDTPADMVARRPRAPGPAPFDDLPLYRVIAHAMRGLAEGAPGAMPTGTTATSAGPVAVTSTGGRGGPGSAISVAVVGIVVLGGDPHPGPVPDPAGD